MRLIDADALMKVIDNELFSTESRKCYEKMRVRKQPTIDAEPVRHERWIEVDRITWRGADDHPIDITVEEKCSNCGRHVERYETVEQENYCPSCGAQMDLKEE